MNICTAWNGTREILGRTKSYHATISVSDEPRREALCNKQDRWVLESLRRLGTSSASVIHKDLMGDMLLSSVRRSLNTLLRRGLVRKTGTRPGPHKHPETTWTVA